MNIKIFEGGKPPVYKHDDDACADCHARIKTGEITLLSGKRTLVPLGVAIELPSGFEAVIRPRSGLSKRGIDCAIGTIDAGFRAEVQACIINNSGEDFVIHNGDRICQMKIQEARQFAFERVSELSDTERGTAGWGSTGV